MGPIRAEILIDAPPRAVFEVVLDVERYPEWNTFTPRISVTNDELEVGRELDLDCQIAPGELLVDEREVILALDKERLSFCMGTSRTRGRPGIRSERWQRCLLASYGRTRFVNSEAFTGPLAPAVELLYRRKLRRAFGDYCRALKRRVESSHRQASA